VVKLVVTRVVALLEIHNTSFNICNNARSTIIVLSLASLPDDVPASNIKHYFVTQQLCRILFYYQTCIYDVLSFVTRRTHDDAPSFALFTRKTKHQTRARFECRGYDPEYF
jgi:hypothetical protein